MPVWPLCPPSPATYPHLSTYLYSKHTDLFMKSVLLRPPPSKFQQDPSQVPGFTRGLAETFTVQTLVKHALMVFGVWRNVCTLGVFDDNLWDSEMLDTLWDLLLIGMIAIGTEREWTTVVTPLRPGPGYLFISFYTINYLQIVDRFHIWIRDGPGTVTAIPYSSFIFTFACKILFQFQVTTTTSTSSIFLFFFGILSSPYFAWYCKFHLTASLFFLCA